MIGDVLRPEGGALARFTRDLTADARAGRLEPVRCRDQEIARVIDILLRHGKNNPTLVGPAGVGKTAIAEGLAQRIATAGVPVVLRDVRLLSLDHVALLAGTTYRGQYEERIRILVEETTSAGDVILFVDELHNLIGQGTALGAAMDAANMLKPALVRGDFRVIGATTDDEYTRWILGDPALERRFQKLAVRELGETEALEILAARKERLERHHNVVIADDALLAAVKLTDLFVRDRLRPDKAIDALDEACAHMQAVTLYPPHIEELIRAARDAGRATRRGTRDEGRGARDEVRDPSFDQFAQNGLTALERFGAELEALFMGAPVVRPQPEDAAPVHAMDEEPTRDASRVPRPHEGPTRPSSLVPRPSTDLRALLADAGIIVRPADIARVVSLMCGQEVRWEV